MGALPVHHDLRKCARSGIKAIMQIPRETLAIQQAAERLADIFGISDLADYAKLGVRTNDGSEWDAVFSIRGHSFVLEWKRSGSLGHVADAIHQLGMAQSSFPHEVVPLLAVPYMGEAAQKRCAQAELPWLDLSGNARIIVPGIFYQNLGHPSQFPPAWTARERIRAEGLSNSETVAHGTFQGSEAARDSLQRRLG